MSKDDMEAEAVMEGDGQVWYYYPDGSLKSADQLRAEQAKNLISV